MLKQVSLTKIAFVLIALLVFEYAFGMVANLFVSFPESAPEAQQWAYAGTQWSVSIHMLVAVMLVVGVAWLHGAAMQQKHRVWRIASGIALIGVIGASVCGARFVATQQEYYSLLMALLFVVALLSLAWGAYAARAVRDPQAA